MKAKERGEGEDREDGEGMEGNGAGRIVKGVFPNLDFFFPLGRLSNTYAGGCVRKGRGERKQKWKEGIGKKGI